MAITKFSHGIVTAMAAASLSACAADRYGDYGTKETVGTLAGAALGAWAGSAVDDDGSGGVVAVAAGTLLGGLIGNQLGRGLDKVDRMQMAQSQYRALEYMPSGRVSTWRNPDSGNYGSFTARPAYTQNDGDVCRPYTHTVTIDGRQQTLNGTACRDNQGRWHEAS